MTRPRRPTIRKGPATHYASPGELIVEFSDGRSGGLISLMRTANGKLTLDVYRQDADVEVRVAKLDPPQAQQTAPLPE